MAEKVTFIDPPSGWRYGFPREYDRDKDGPVTDFLLHHGYPEEEIPFACSYLRVWNEEVPSNI